MLRLTCILVSKGLLPVLLLAWMLASAGTGAADGGQAEIERLKQRVNGYFSAVHSRQFTKAGNSSCRVPGTPSTPHGQGRPGSPTSASSR